MNRDNERPLLEELEAMDTQQLDELLHTELEKDEKDSERVLQILRVLEAREAGDPNNDVDVESAWKEYQEGLQRDATLLKKPAAKIRRWVGMVAAVAAVVCVLIVAAPKVMGVENIFELIGRWTQTIFGFSNSTDSTDPQEEYVFKTDHPGLQQIYDAVTEQGVTQLVVPSWVPEGFELDELKTMPVRDGVKVLGSMIKGDSYISFVIEVYEEIGTNTYTKDEDDVEVYEKEGVKHYIMANEDSYQIVWAVDNLECMILTNCEENNIYKIIKSIYAEVIK